MYDLTLLGLKLSKLLFGRGVMKDVIVTGGRHYADQDKMQSVLQLFDIAMLIQGGATGADNLARIYASKNKVYIETFEADWDKHGRAAGPIRNNIMLEENRNAVVIAFPGGNGTDDCVRSALSKGMTVLRVL